MSIYQLYGSVSAAADGVARIDVQFQGEIVGYSLEVEGNLNGDQDRVAAEVSFLSASMMTSNDARGVIASIQGRISLITSGMAAAAFSKTLSGLYIPVVAGERIYLHVPVMVGINTAVARCHLYVLDSSNPNLRRRR